MPIKSALFNFNPEFFEPEARLASVPIRCSKCLPERGPTGRSLHESSPRLCKGEENKRGQLEWKPNDGAENL